ncbi:MAG: hemerythrin family protein [Mariprofundales bacterium]|nr:hemerythrin family protein [Mariprofundales bacterium]
MMSNQGQKAHRIVKLVHDLNSIWTGLLGSTELLQLSISPDTPEYEYIQMMLASIEQGEAITEEISTIAHNSNLSDSDHTQPLSLLDSSTTSLANSALDQDHRHLEQMIAQLPHIEGSTEVHSIIAEINQFCLHHFYREEQIMGQCPDYPFRTHHHETHCILLDRLQQIERQCSSADMGLDDIRSGANEIATMLPLHIMGMDAGMLPYISARPELAQYTPTTPDDGLLADHFRLSADKSRG